jgi:hypothetical protein
MLMKPTLLSRMYSCLRRSVNVAALLWLLPQTGSAAPALACDPALAALFTPARPRLGRYEVCTTPEALEVVAPPAWTIEVLPPLDVFGAAGIYSRMAIARLYRGRRPLVARGAIVRDGRVESLTLVSPHPDASLHRLLPGTLIIRHLVAP